MTNREIKEFGADFAEFWEQRGRYMDINNPERTYGNMRGRIAACRSIYEIDDYVIESRSNRVTLRKIILAFYEFLEDKHGEPIETSLKEMKFYDTLERRIEIAKFLHRPKTLSEIEKHFHISRRTREKDMEALQEGIEVFGAGIRVREIREQGEVRYRATIHPVFLPLNLTQVNTLINYLDEIASADARAGVIADISARIKNQLSDYAKETLGNRTAAGVGAGSNDYLDDEAMAHADPFPYLFKSNSFFDFAYNGAEYNGRIVHYRNCMMTILTSEGELLKDIAYNEISIDPDSIKYR